MCWAILIEIKYHFHLKESLIWSENTNIKAIIKLYSNDRKKTNSVIQSPWLQWLILWLSHAWGHWEHPRIIVGTIGKETLVFSRIINSKDSINLECTRPQCEESRHGKKKQLDVGERRKVEEERENLKTSFKALIKPCLKLVFLDFSFTWAKNTSQKLTVLFFSEAVEVILSLAHTQNLVYNRCLLFARAFAFRTFQTSGQHAQNQRTKRSPLFLFHDT